VSLNDLKKFVKQDYFHYFCLILPIGIPPFLKTDLVSGLPGQKKLKRPNLAISSFKKGQILKNEKKAK